MEKFEKSFNKADLCHKYYIGNKAFILCCDWLVAVTVKTL